MDGLPAISYNPSPLVLGGEEIKSGDPLALLGTLSHLFSINTLLYPSLAYKKDEV